VPQFQVRHEGRFVACVDLAYPERKLAIEYDGLWHGGRGSWPGSTSAQRPRSAGWRVIHVTAADLHGMDRIATAVRGALAA